MTSALRPAQRLLVRLLGGGLAAVLCGLAVAALAGDPSSPGPIAGALYVLATLLVTALLVARAVLIGGERAAWLLFAATAVLDLAALVVWSVGYDSASLSPADALWSAGLLCSFAGVLLYLGHRVGDGLRAFRVDGLGITLYTTAIAAALLVPAMRAHSGSSTLTASLNVLYPCANAALWSLVLAAGTMSGRRLERQDLLLAAAFVLQSASDAMYALGQAGIVSAAGSLTAGVATVVPLSLLVLAAWSRPSSAGSLRVGGWWETFPTVSWIVAGGTILVVAAFTPVEPVAVVLAAAALAAAVLRTVLITHDVRQLVVHRRLALTDELTGLPNRRALLRDLNLLCRHGAHSDHAAALLIADLDGFKELNDTLGHAAGDLLLASLAERLREIPGAHPVRLGGDEFAAIVRAPHDAHAVVEAMARALGEPVTLGEVAVGVAASIGVARFPGDAHTAQELLRQADVAMYDAKRRRAGAALYAPERDGHRRARVELAADLQRALAGDDPGAAGLWVAFQPQAELHTHRIAGVEALVRWTHPQLGSISPAELIPIAERTGTLNALTDWVLDRSLAAAAAWQRVAAGLRVSVNVSALTLIDAGLPGRVAAALDHHAVPAGHLVVEVTEDAVMADAQRGCEVLGELAAMGVGISIDDFGTGQSSLTQLRRIGADELKIDRSFVQRMGDDRFDREVVVAVIGLGRRLGMRVVAEGVEDRPTWHALGGLSCDLAQGFGIARPVALEALVDVLAAAPGTGWPMGAPLVAA